MATKISELVEATVVDNANDFLLMTDVSDTTMAASGSTKKVNPDKLPISTAVAEQLERIVYDAVTYGIVADGVTENDVAWNAMIDDVKAGNDAGIIGQTPIIRLPQGTIKIAAPIVLYSGIKIEGHGIATKISPTAGFTGAGLFYLKPGTSSWIQDVEICDLSTEGTHITLTDEYYGYACTGVTSTDTITAVGHAFVTNQMVWLKAGTLVGGSALTANTTYYVRNISGNTFQLASTSGGAALNLGTDITSATIETVPATIQRCRFHNIYLSGSNGIVLRNYCQATLFEDIYSAGPIDKMLWFTGNWNVLRRINKEGISGTSVDPYIKISHIYDGNRSDGNLIDGINIEGGGNGNKTPFYFHGCDNLYIQNLWCELQAVPSDPRTDGYVMRFEDCFNVNILGAPSVQMPDAYAKIKVDTTLNLYIEQMYLDPTGVSLYSIFEIADDSNVTVGTLVSRSNDGAIKCVESKNLRIQRVYSKNSGLIDGPTTFLETLYTGNNMFVNGSFENLTHNWTIDSGATVTSTLVDSGVALGKAMQCTLASVGSFSVHQSITFTAEHVGKPFTFTGAVRTTTTNGYITPYLYGPGGLNQSTNRVSHGRGEWTIISQTFTPLAAGACQVGVYCWDLTLAQLDEFSIVPGTIGTLASSSFRSLEVNGRSITIGNAPPTGGNGTWRVGDLRYNSEPAADEYAGWMCITAGDPGVWIGFGTLSSTKKIYGTVGGIQVELDATSSPLIRVVNTATNLGYSVAHIGGINYIDTDTYQLRDRTSGTILESYSPGAGRAFNTPTDILIKSSTPASASATGVAGNVVYSADYIYVCVATNTWKRAALSTW
jgi:Pectate lyase superfamily protein